MQLRAYAIKLHFRQAHADERCEAALLRPWRQCDTGETTNEAAEEGAARAWLQQNTQQLASVNLVQPLAADIHAHAAA